MHVVLSSISAIYDPIQLYYKLLERRTVGAFYTSIRSTTVGFNSLYVLDVDTVTTFVNDDEYETDTDDNTTITKWDHKLLDNMDI